MPSTSTMTGVLTEEQFLSQVNQYSDELNSLVTNANDKINPRLSSELWELSDEELSQLYGKRVKKINNGAGYSRMYAVESEPYYSASNPINSNTSTVNRGVIRQPINTTKSPTTGKAIFSNVAKAGKNFKFFAGAAASAATAASVGIWLGKTIDGALYNANPNFWNDLGLSSLNPDRWSEITRGDDSLGSGLFNFIFGIDPNTGETQAYIDSAAASYMAMGLSNAGLFNSENKSSIPQDIKSQLDPNNTIEGYIYPSDPVTEITVYNYRKIGSSYADPHNGLFTVDTYTFNDPVQLFYKEYISPSGTGYAKDVIGGITSKTATTYSKHRVYYNGSTQNSTGTFSQSKTFDSETAYWLNPSPENTEQASVAVLESQVPYSIILAPTEFASGLSNYRNAIEIAAWTICYGDNESGSDIEGIGNQEGAVLPNFSGLETLDDYDNYLRSAYPQTYSDSVPITYLDENGNEQTTEYIPVPFPNISNYTDTQPTSGTATQTSVQELVEQMTQLLQQYTTPTNTANPTDTGEGSPSPIIAPNGSASALWSVYHPTQAQIDSFGAWLWSPNFIDQIAKIFNNPMESIIGLHKVYATPIDAGTSTIHVGYLDSGVSSAYVTQQYVEVDCGTINLYEQFGNVMDYSPFTSVQLYLPFIGIVPLSIDDVMRADISITYGVDVFTGACLAMVDVQRDMGGGVLYQYSGNCGVQYPISSGSYMGIVAGIASIAGGVVATIATGGGAAPALLGAAGAAMSMHTDVQHSGSFSGNSGAMGGKVPYLIVSRPQSAMYGYEEVIEGLPANAYITIGQCSGFVKARNVELVGVIATEDELSEIESLLLNGVYV